MENLFRLSRPGHFEVAFLMRWSVSLYIQAAVVFICDQICEKKPSTH